jgi:hypothetical protein
MKNNGGYNEQNNTQGKLVYTQHIQPATSQNT